MSILIDENTKVLIQGFTGQTGTFHAEEMIQYGTNIVGGVTPGKGRTTHLGLPVFNTVKEAIEDTGATSTIIFVPPPFAADSIMEAAKAGLEYAVCITDGIPAHDMIRVKRYLRLSTTNAANKHAGNIHAFRKPAMILTGPNCAGTISPGKAMLGIMPGHIYQPGDIGIVSRSGTLGYEAAVQLKDAGIGISTSVGIGGDPVNGSSFRDVLELFEQDEATKAVVMIGEIGGPQEAEAAAYFKTEMTKPVIGYIAGLTVPKGKRMGHAGAIISAFGESAAEKVTILEESGITVVPNPNAFAETVQAVRTKHAA